MEGAITRMRAPPQTQPIERSQTAVPSMPFQTEATQYFGTIGGEPRVHGPPNGTSIEITRTTVPARPSEPKIRSLKLEMPEKYSGSR